MKPNATLIVPLGGQSSRFPGVRPKWLLTHPSGRIMLYEAIRQLPLNKFNRVVFAILKEHDDKYSARAVILEELYGTLLGLDTHTVQVVVLDAPTIDPAQTVREAIRLADVPLDAPIVVKDCDNTFTINAPEIIGSSFVAVAHIGTLGAVEVGNKSYAKMSQEGVVGSFAERDIISPWMCVGAYGFRSAEAFLLAEEAARGTHEEYTGYLSQILTLTRDTVFSVVASEYADWGTLEDWNRYCATFTTLFVDLDGCLFKNAGQYTTPALGEAPPIEANLLALRQLMERGRTTLVFTTARSERHRNLTLMQLRENGFIEYTLLMGLPHARRVLINDFSATNPYPSAVAINLPRDSTDLAHYLRSVHPHA